MISQWSTRRYFALGFFVLLIASSLVGIGLHEQIAWAAGYDNDWKYVVRIEEDWSLLVNQPDTTKSSPQVSTQMARTPTQRGFATSISIPATSRPSGKAAYSCSAGKGASINPPCRSKAKS